MVDTLVHYDERHTTCRLTVLPDNLFVDDGHLSASGLVEHIAQTCAARIGYYNKYVLGRGITLGFIGAIRDLTIHRLPTVGQTLETTIEVQEEVFGMTLATARVTVEGILICETEMKIAQSEQPVL